MKHYLRKITLVLCVVIALCVVIKPINAAAVDIHDIERSISEIEPRAQKFDVLEDISSFITEITNFFSELANSNTLISQAIDTINKLLDPADSTWVSDWLKAWATEMAASVGDMFDLVEAQLENGVDANILSNSKYKKDINNILSYISVTAATFTSIFWAIGQVKNAIHYEEWTEKKFALAIGTVGISATLILNSAKVCLWIYRQEAALVTNVLGSGSSIREYIENAATNGNYIASGTSSGVPIIGVVLDFIASFFMFIPFGLCIIFLLIMACLVYIKLILRELEIATMACVSPIFFGCWVSDTTRPYLKNFIATFLSVVFETVFMAITLRLGGVLLSQKLVAQGSLEMIKVMEVFVLSGAIMVMCFKPPQILTNLVRA